MLKNINIYLRETWSLLKETYKGWSVRDPFRQSAAIAYYAVFSLPALLVIVISLAGLFFEKEAVSGEISSQISSTLGKETAKQIEIMVAKAANTGKSLPASIIGFITLIIGASGVFGELQKSLNIIWEVKEKPKKSF
jgi:membrane protein